MSSLIARLGLVATLASLPVVGLAQETRPENELKLHAIFTSNMVLQRDKPVAIWGWAKPGSKVSVTFGKVRAESSVGANGRWEAKFAAMEASNEPREMKVISDGKTIELPVFDGHGDGNIWASKVDHVEDIDVRVMHDAEGVMIFSGKEIDEATQQIIRTALESAGHENVQFAGGDDGGPHGVHVVRKVEVQVTE